jgi:hypothetical protein
LSVTRPGKSVIIVSPEVRPWVVFS